MSNSVEFSDRSGGARPVASRVEDRTRRDKIPGDHSEHTGAGDRGPEGRGFVGDSSKRKRQRVRTSRAMSLKTLAKEYIWLWDVRHGVSIKEIAMREGISVPRVRFGVARSRAQESSCATEGALRPPRLIPLFPLGPLTPQSACGHHRPIEAGSLFCCVICHISGIDDHPALKRDPVTDPAPEPKPADAPKKIKGETRKERRQRLFGASAMISAS